MISFHVRILLKYVLKHSENILRKFEKRYSIFCDLRDCSSAIHCASVRYQLYFRCWGSGLVIGD